MKIKIYFWNLFTPVFVLKGLLITLFVSSENKINDQSERHKHYSKEYRQSVQPGIHFSVQAILPNPSCNTDVSGHHVRPHGSNTRFRGHSRCKTSKKPLWMRTAVDKVHHSLWIHCHHNHPNNNWAQKKHWSTQQFFGFIFLRTEQHRKPKRSYPKSGKYKCNCVNVQSAILMITHKEAKGWSIT